MRRWLRNRRRWALRYALIQRETEERAFEDAVWWLLRAQTALLAVKMYEYRQKRDDFIAILREHCVTEEKTA